MSTTEIAPTATPIPIPPRPIPKQGWIRRLVGYMKPHKKNAYIAFGVAIGGQLIQSLLPLVQKVVVDDVITPHTNNGHAVPVRRSRRGSR